MLVQNRKPYFKAMYYVRASTREKSRNSFYFLERECSDKNIDQSATKKM